MTAWMAAAAVRRHSLSSSPLGDHWRLRISAGIAVSGARPNTVASTLLFSSMYCFTDASCATSHGDDDDDDDDDGDEEEDKDGGAGLRFSSADSLRSAGNDDDDDGEDDDAAAADDSSCSGWPAR